MLIHGGQGMWLLFSAHGVAEKVSLVLLGYGALDLQQGNSGPSPWKISAAVLPWPHQVMFNLQADMPRRPCCSGTVHPRYSTAPNAPSEMPLLPPI
jgi:hypothetical protein